MLKEYFLIGKISKPKGIKGEVKAIVFSDNIENVAKTKVLYFLEDGEFIAKKNFKTRVYDSTLFIHFDDILNRSDAEKLRNTEIYLDRKSAAPLGEDEEYIVDLIGCKAILDTGESFGQLVDVLQPGSTDVYIFKTNEATVLIPALKSVIIKVDIKEKEITINKEKLHEVAVFEYKNS